MKLSLCLLLSVWLCTTNALHAQQAPSLQPSRYSFQLTHILLKDGTLKTGWLLGTCGDTLVAQIGKISERISRRDLVRVDVERPSQKGSATLAGVLMGIYAGNAWALKAENQPFIFMRENNEGELALLSALFGLIGGVIGNLVVAAAGNATSFDLSGDEAANAVAWEDFVKSNSTAYQKSDLHLSFQGGWVSGPLPGPSNPASYYSYGYYADATSLNMLRKAQLTYSVTRFCDVGLAFLWLGQPTVSHFEPTYGGGMTASLEGTGQYAVGVFQPLWELGSRNVQWDIAAGIGVASYKCQAASPPYQFFADSLSTAKSVEQKNTTFSTLLYTEFKVFLADYFSLGLAADWVYIPDKVPVVSGFTFDRDQLGTSSIGFVLTFHL